jgi:hypothetical protein
MKKQLINITILIFSLILCTSLTYGPRKCKGDAEYQQAIKKMTGFRLIKDYRISLDEGEGTDSPTMSFPISLTNGLKYKFILINNPSNEGKMIMSIFLNAKKEMLIATSQRVSTNKHYPSIEFECRNSGTYHMSFSFEGALKGCGVGVFSVIK